MIEQPRFLPAAVDTLFCIETLPDDPSGVGVVLAPAGGYTFTPQRNRWGVEFARRLAAAGHQVVRFDWAGIGDSTGSVDTFALDRPAVSDLRLAMGCVRESRIVIVGQCYGARTALALAAEDGAVAGVILISPPVRDHARGEGTATKKAYDLSASDYLKEGAKRIRFSMLTDRTELVRMARIGRAFAKARWKKATARFRETDPAPWLSKPFLNQLTQLVSRGTPCLVVYGSEENDYLEFAEARQGRLGRLLSAASSVDVEVLPGSVHALDRVEVQEAVIATTEAWLRRLG